MKVIKCSFTLVEVLMAFFILSIAILGALGIYRQSVQGVHSARSMQIATRDLSAVMETLRTMNCTEIQDEQRNSLFWSGLLSGELQAQQLSVTEINTAAGADWTARPLRLRVNLSWTDQGRNKEISMMSVFTDE